MQINTVLSDLPPQIGSEKTKELAVKLLSQVTIVFAHTLKVVVSTCMLLICFFILKLLVFSGSGTSKRLIINKDVKQDFLHLSRLAKDLVWLEGLYHEFVLKAYQIIYSLADVAVIYEKEWTTFLAASQDIAAKIQKVTVSSTWPHIELQSRVEKVFQSQEGNFKAVINMETNMKAFLTSFVEILSILPSNIHEVLCLYLNIFSCSCQFQKFAPTAATYELLCHLLGVDIL